MQRATATFATIFLLGASLTAQETPRFSDNRWARSGDSTRVEIVEGREVLRLDTGTAIWRDLQLLDGTIDVDVQLSSRRSFAYVNFRMQNEGEYEEFYLRPHKSLLPDAIQYAPVFQGQSQWQLYHGSRGTAAPAIVTGGWTHLRIVLSGRRAAFFVGDTITPAMVISRLAREPQAGGIELRGFLAPGTAGQGAVARFANLRVRSGVVAYDFASVRAPEPLPAGIITAWNVAPPFAAPESTLMVLPKLAAGDFTEVAVEPEGFALLHRALRMPAVQRYVGTVAKVSLVAAKAGMRTLELGFSDRVTVFLNGRPIFARDDSYDFQNRRDGLLSLNQATVYLPLRAGPNELAVIVTDRFGGWAVMGRIADRTGLTIRPE